MVQMIHCLLILLCSQLHPGYPTQPPKNVQVVTQIRLQATHDAKTVEKTYTDEESMVAILNYLRLLDPYEQDFIDPSTFRADAYEITLCYSDGTRRTYRQLYDEYLQKDGGPWKKIEGQSGLLFPSLWHIIGHEIQTSEVSHESLETFYHNHPSQAFGDGRLLPGRAGLAGADP